MTDEEKKKKNRQFLEIISKCDPYVAEQLRTDDICDVLITEMPMKRQYSKKDKENDRDITLLQFDDVDEGIYNIQTNAIKDKSLIHFSDNKNKHAYVTNKQEDTELIHFGDDKDNFNSMEKNIVDYTLLRYEDNNFGGICSSNGLIGSIASAKVEFDIIDLFENMFVTPEHIKTKKKSKTTIRDDKELTKIINEEINKFTLSEINSKAEVKASVGSSTAANRSYLYNENNNNVRCIDKSTQSGDSGQNSPITNLILEAGNNFMQTPEDNPRIVKESYSNHCKYNVTDNFYNDINKKFEASSSFHLHPVGDISLRTRFIDRATQTIYSSSDSKSYFHINDNTTPIGKDFTYNFKEPYSAISKSKLVDSELTFNVCKKQLGIDDKSSLEKPTCSLFNSDILFLNNPIIDKAKSQTNECDHNLKQDVKNRPCNFNEYSSHSSVYKDMKDDLMSALLVSSNNRKDFTNVSKKNSEGDINNKTELKASSAVLSSENITFELDVKETDTFKSIPETICYYEDEEIEIDRLAVNKLVVNYLNSIKTDINPYSKNKFVAKNETKSIITGPSLIEKRNEIPNIIEVLAKRQANNNKKINETTGKPVKVKQMILRRDNFSSKRKFKVAASVEPENKIVSENIRLDPIILMEDCNKSRLERHNAQKEFVDFVLGKKK